MPDLTDPLAAALAKLRPAPAAAEKPAFLFRAGQASRDAVARRWKWVAATAVVLLVGSWAVGVALFAEADRRLAVAEARAQELTATLPAGPPVPPTPARPPVFAVPDAPVSPTPPTYDPDPTPQELADALQLRHDILTAGLSLLPPSRPPVATAGDIRHILPGGVFTTPRHEPKKPTPIFPDDENE